MRARAVAAFILRESRGSRARLVFFTACLAVGVAAVVAVAGLSSALDAGIRSEARRLLAADLAVEAHRAPPPSLEEALAAEPGVRTASIRGMATIASVCCTPDERAASTLVQLKAVGPGWPFYGDLSLQPDRPLAELLDPQGVLIAPELMDRLGVGPGDGLRIGFGEFRIRGAVLSEPDRLNVSFTLGPRVLMSLEALERTGLIGFGSHVHHRLIARLPDGSPPAEADRLAARAREVLEAEGVATAFDVQTAADAQPALRAGLQRAGRFLGLVALLSLLIGGVGVASTVRAWLAGRMDAIATLKCLGLRQREILALYLGQTALLGLAGSLAGALLGTGLMLLAPRLLDGLLPAVPIALFQPGALLRGVGLGMGVAMLFAFPTLAGLRRIAPLRAVRHDAEPVPASLPARAGVAAALAAGIFATAWIQSESASMALRFVAGIAGAVAALSVAALFVTRLAGRAAARRLQGRASSVWLRHGLAALSRPGSGAFGAIVALGLGVLVVVGMYLVQARLSEQLRAELPDDAPTAFLADVRTHQWDGVRALLAEEGAVRIESVPIVTARLTSVDGRPVEEIAPGGASGAVTPGTDEGRRRWVMTREQNLTFLDALPAGNEIVAGAWRAEGAPPGMSIERDFAEDLGAAVGSRLVFDIQGVPFEMTVTSLRTVDWRTFGINFFLVAEPGLLEEAPQLRVGAARLPAGAEQAVQDRLAREFPNVLLLKVREIIEKVAAVLDRVGLGVRVIGGFSVLAGVAILAGAVGAGSVRRGREVALLKTLGMTRRGVIAVYSVEYGLVGLVAGGIGVAGGALLAWAVLTQGMEIGWVTPTGALAIALAGTVVLSVLAGLAASLRALSRRPIEALRAE